MMDLPGNAELERLAILAEEMGEAQQVVGKILRHGYESWDPTEPQPSPTNRALLEIELGHVVFAMSLLTESHDLDDDLIISRAEEKGEKIKPYLHFQEGL